MQLESDNSILILFKYFPSILCLIRPVAQLLNDTTKQTYRNHKTTLQLNKLSAVLNGFQCSKCMLEKWIIIIRIMIRHQCIQMNR